jgi:SNF2 family DNA or RNA helicase
MAKAICSLPASSRWAVTGTPIQNRLGDLVALLKFLQAHPYGDTGRFEADITHLWKTGEEQQVKEAVRRLQRLSGCLLLRRPKETINLPRRQDLRCIVEFTIDERALYDEIKGRIIAKFKETTPKDTGRSSSITFANVIQQINSLRMICNMGLQYHSRYDNSDAEEKTKWAEAAQQVFDFQCEAGSIICQLCSSSLDMAETLLGEPENQTQPRFSQCLRFICSECTQRLHRSSNPVSCGHSMSHPAPMSLIEDYQTSLIGLPSKVTSLVNQLQAQPADVKW